MADRINEIPWFKRENYDIKKLKFFDKQKWVEQFIVRFYIREIRTSDSSYKNNLNYRFATSKVRNEGIVNIHDIFDLTPLLLLDFVKFDLQAKRVTLYDLKKDAPQTYALIEAYYKNIEENRRKNRVVRGLTILEIKEVEKKHNSNAPHAIDSSWQGCKNQSMYESLKYLQQAEKEYDESVGKVFVSSSNRLLISVDLTAPFEEIKKEIHRIYNDEKAKAVTSVMLPANVENFADCRLLPCIDLLEYKEAANDKISNAAIVRKSFDLEDSSKYECFKTTTKKWIKIINNFKKLYSFISNSYDWS